MIFVGKWYDLIYRKPWELLKSPLKLINAENFWDSARSTYKISSTPKTNT